MNYALFTFEVMSTISRFDGPTINITPASEEDAMDILAAITWLLVADRAFDNLSLAVETEDYYVLRRESALRSLLYHYNAMDFTLFITQVDKAIHYLRTKP